MSLTRVLTLASMLVAGVFAQGNNPLLGRWTCSLHETYRVDNGQRGGGDFDNNIDFSSDHTAVISGVSDATSEPFRTRARWSGGPDNFTFQAEDGVGKYSGAVTGNLLSMRSDYRDGDINTHSEWTCRSVRNGGADPTVKFLNRYALPINLEVYECKTSFPSTRDEILRDLVLQPQASAVVSCRERVGLCMRWKIADKGDSFGNFYGVDCNVHPPGSHDAFDNPNRQKVVTP
jgi:hypothetical protein